MTITMQCSVEHEDESTEQFDFLWMDWRGPGRVLWFHGEKGRDVAKINPDLVKELRIEMVTIDPRII